MSGVPPPAPEPAGDAVLVLRVWVQTPEGPLVGRLLTATQPEGVVTVGLDAITALVRDAVAAFAGTHQAPSGVDRDAPATPPEQSR